MGINLMKIASVYLVIGILFGMFMSITHKFGYASVHAHINLLGWASLALAGIIYYLFPSASESVLAKIHFWLHNLGLPVMMIGLILLVNEVAGVEPVIATGGVLVTLGIIAFMFNMLKNVRR